MSDFFDFGMEKYLLLILAGFPSTWIMIQFTDTENYSFMDMFMVLLAGSCVVFTVASFAFRVLKSANSA